MQHSVLILDDDADFNSLLTDIFEQADYIVTSLTDPIEAVDVFRDTDYDLVVTDHKMPEMTGAEFMKVIKRIKPEVPVIMVSGYLENDTIRELISDGVGGVFLKPLNIFSLLERTAELIEEAKKLQNTPGNEGHGSSDALNETGAVLGFIFRSYPCKSGAAASFAERLYSLRSFKSTLSLIGEPGMHYRKICEDIRGFYESDAEAFIYLDSANFNEAHALQLLQEAKDSGMERITCVLLEVEKMDASQKELAVLLAKQADAFDHLDTSIRTIFCVSGDLDSLFDEGAIDENLYILMGTAEVRVPPLRDCQVDVGIMAQQLAAEIAREQSLGTVPRFERSARDLLRQHPWTNNYEELRATVSALVKGNAAAGITHAAVKAALQGVAERAPCGRMEAYLAQQKLDYLRAVSILSGRDRSKTARFFATTVEAVEQAIK
jgi:DNA-binding NtrC family response regulator